MTPDSIEVEVRFDKEQMQEIRDLIKESNSCNNVDDDSCGRVSSCIYVEQGKRYQKAAYKVAHWGALIVIALEDLIDSLPSDAMTYPGVLEAVQKAKDALK